MANKTSIALLAVVILVVAIVAAVFIPVYFDRQYRAQVSQVLAAVPAWQRAVEEHYKVKRQFPNGPSDLAKSDLPPPTASPFGAVKLGANGSLTVEMLANSGVAGSTVVFRPAAAGSQIRWDCTSGTLKPAHRPANCRP